MGETEAVRKAKNILRGEAADPQMVLDLVKKELKKFEKEEKDEKAFEELPSFMAVEKKYEMLLKKVLEKFK